MLDTLEQESKRRNLIVDNTIHSPTTHILVSSSMDGASNTCSSTSKGKAKIPDIEVEEDNATLMESRYGEDENLGAFLSGQFCEEFNHYVPDDENVAPQQPCQVVQYPNRICHPAVDVNVTPTIQTKKKSRINVKENS